METTVPQAPTQPINLNTSSGNTNMVNPSGNSVGLVQNVPKIVAFNMNDLQNNSIEQPFEQSNIQNVPFSALVNEVNGKQRAPTFRNQQSILRQHRQVPQLSAPSNNASNANHVAANAPSIALTVQGSGTGEGVTAAVNIEQVSTDLGGYTIFGIHLSRTTVYIIVAFIIAIICYYVYTKYYCSNENKSDKKKKKRNQEVSYKEQETLNKKDNSQDKQQDRPQDKTSDKDSEE
jgi:preprotein translocase subunit SecG